MQAQSIYTPNSLYCLLQNPLVEAYIFLPPNHHGGKLSSHLTAQDVSLLLQLERRCLYSQSLIYIETLLPPI